MLEKIKKDIDKELKSLPSMADRDFNLKSSKLLYAGIQDFLNRNGKRIRPILFVLSYQGYTKRKDFSYKKLIRASLSLELLHDFFLVHDDVIDKSALRRGKPTLHRFFNSKLGVSSKNEIGPNLSIAAGDILFALAVNTLLSFEEESFRKEKTLSLFTKIAASTGEGEFIDVVNNIKKIEKITEKEVLFTYTLKTAKYTFEGPLLLGATLAGAKKEEIRKLSRLGITLGLAFQIQDDLLDVFSSSKRIGKPVLSDLNESKKTLLVWKTYRNLSASGKIRLKRLLKKKKKTYSDLLSFRKLIISAGGGKYCLAKIASLLLEADSILSEVRMNPKYKAALEKLKEDLAAKTALLEKTIREKS